MKPITPKQVKENIELPEIAIAVVNKLITHNFKGIESIFTKEKLIKELLERGYNTESIDTIIINIPAIFPINLYANGHIPNIATGTAISNFPSGGCVHS